MVIMKRLLILSITVFLVSAVMLAQEKIVDQSGKRQAWVGGTEEDYIITSSEGLTLEEAKSKALVSVRDRIVNSVAVVVKSSSTINVNESNNNDIYDYLEQYSKSTSNTSADQNFVKGISESKVEGYYWEKVLDKKTGKVKYVYHIKYSFPQVEVRKLVAEFERRDREMTDKLDAISAMVDKYNTVEEMTSANAELSKLIAYFPDQRKSMAQADLAKLTKILSSISTEVISQELGKVEVRLVYAGRLIKTSKAPSIKSNCCTVISNKQVDGIWTLNYDYENCFDDMENTIDIVFTQGVNTKAKIYVNTKIASVEFMIVPPFKVNNNNLTFEVKSVAGAFTITKMEIEVNGINRVVVIDNINHAVKDEGLNTVVVSSDNISSLYGNINGTIYYREAETGTVKSKRFSGMEIKRH